MKQIKENKGLKSYHLSLIGFVTVLVFTLITVLISWLLYEQTVALLTQNLKERLLSIVRTAAVQIEVNDINKLQTENDYKKPEWKKVVTQLRKVRENNDDILFVYIFRKSKEDFNNLEFIADSHSQNPYAKIDLNNDGLIDDADQLQWPGQPYEGAPQEAYFGFVQPITNASVYEDQWGSEITGYAPIKDGKGNAIAVLAVDIKANDFHYITTQTLYPFLLFILVLTFLLILLSSILIYFWNKRLQLIAELDRQKDELLSIVSHQLATPVSSIKWYIEMLLDGDLGHLTAEQKDHLESVQSVASNLADLVSLILDVSRIQLGRIKVEKSELNLQEFFNEILKIIEPKAVEKGVTFNKFLPVKFPVAHLDRRYTHMTIENLLSNAIKYTPKGGIVNFTVEVKNNILYCTVQDTGVGIPKEDQSKIFGKLYRASNVRNTVDGNGFGLYVAKGAIEAQGGKIRFASEENKGTTFYIELPLH